MIRLGFIRIGRTNFLVLGLFSFKRGQLFLPVIERKQILSIFLLSPLAILRLIDTSMYTTNKLLQLKKPSSLFDRANRGYEISIDRDVHQDHVMAQDVRF